MRRVAWAIVLSLMLGLFGLAEARADVLFKSVSDFTGRPSSPNLCSNCQGRFHAYSGFALASDAYLTNITLAVGEPCCFQPFTTPFAVSIYDGAANNSSAPLLYGPIMPTYAQISDPYDMLDDAIITFAMPSLRLQKNHDYTISFYGSDFHVAVFVNGVSPLYEGEGNPNDPNQRDLVVQYDVHGQQLTSNSLGFQLDGDLIPGPAPVPEPAAWTMMLLGFAAIGSAARYKAPNRAEA